MSSETYLIIDSSEEYCLSNTAPAGLSDYRQYAGPYAGMVPFSKVFAMTTVGGDRVSEICSSYITGAA